MIGFVYEGYFFCANVHHFQHPSGTEYHITVLTTKSRSDIPSSIVLEDRDDGFLQVSRDPVPPVFLETIISEIEKHNHKVH